MKKENAMEIIREKANAHGFEFENGNSGWHIRDGKDHWSAWVNFTIKEDFNWIMAERKIVCDISVQASIAQMGGNPTVEELLKASDIIKRAAELVAELNSMKLSYVEAEAV